MPNQIIPLLKKSVAGLLILSIGLPPVALAQQTVPQGTGCAPIMGRAFYGACPVEPLSNFQTEQVLRQARRLFVVSRNQLPNNPAQWNDLVHGRSRVDAVEFRFFPERGFASTPGTGNNPGLYFQVIRHQNGRARALGGNSFPLSDGSQAFGLDYSTYNETRLGLRRSYEELYQDYMRECEYRGARGTFDCNALWAGRSFLMYGLPALPHVVFFSLLHASSREQSRLADTSFFNSFLARRFANAERTSLGLDADAHLSDEVRATIADRIRRLTRAERLNLLRDHAFAESTFLADLQQETLQRWSERIARLRGNPLLTQTAEAASGVVHNSIRQRITDFIRRNLTPNTLRQRAANLLQWLLQLEHVPATGSAPATWRMRPSLMWLNNGPLTNNRLSRWVTIGFRKYASNIGFLTLFGAGIVYGGLHAFARDGVTGQLPFASQIAAFWNSPPETEADLLSGGRWRGRATFFHEEYVDRFYLHNYLNIAHQSLGVNGRIVSCLGGAVNPIGMADSQQILEGAAQAAVAGEQLAAAQGQAAPNATPTPAQAEEQATAQAFNELPPSSGGNCVVSHQLNASNEDYVCSNEHNTCVIAQTDRSSIADLSDRMHRYFSNYVRTAHRLRLDGTFLNQPSGQAGGH